MADTLPLTETQARILRGAIEHPEDVFQTVRTGTNTGGLAQSLAGLQRRGFMAGNEATPKGREAYEALRAEGRV